MSLRSLQVATTARYNMQGSRKSARLPRRRHHGADSAVRRTEGPKTRPSLLLPLAVEVGGIGIFETDLEEGRTRFSPELCAILGLPVGTEMSYVEASQLIDERDRATIQSNIEATRTTSDTRKWGRWSGVCRVVRADGKIRWVSVHGRRIYRGRGSGLRPVRSIGTVIDITHLKETEAALRESELRLRLALDAAGMGTFEADITGSQASIDEQEARLLGLPNDTRVVLAEELRKRIPLEDLQTSDIKQARMTEHHEAYHHEFRLSMPDGSERWLAAFADVRSDRIVGVNFDITQRKLAEEALRDREFRLRIATEGAALGIFEWDAIADRTTWENDRIYEIFGRSRAMGPLTKQQFVDGYLHPADARDYDKALSESMRTGSLHIICRIKRNDGAQRWLQIDGTVEGVASGKPKRLVGVVADITTRKLLERAAQRLSARLLAVQEEERRNIAQELHDSTVQHLVAAQLLLTSVRPQSPQRELSLWTDLEGALGEAMKELRTFSYLMHPPALEAYGIRKSLQRYLDGLTERSGITIKLRIDRTSENLPLPLKRSIFRIVQEGLANAYRHASASVVSVALRRIGGRLHVIITDNGRGISVVSGKHRAPRIGAGIRGIEMRLKRLGGRLKFSCPAAGGTRLHAVLPLGTQVL
jgi:PAS domain S-box-containing protein